MRVSFSTYGIGPDGTRRNVTSGLGLAEHRTDDLTDADGNPTNRARHAFAELCSGHALGGIPLGGQIMVSIDGHGSGVLTKVDDGTACVQSAGLPRAVDLWEDTLLTLGITDKSQGIWTGEVTVLASSGDVTGPATTTTGTVEQTGLVNDALMSAMTSALAPFLGLADTAVGSVEKKMAEFVVRAVEVVGGMFIISVGMVLLANLATSGRFISAAGQAVGYIPGVPVKLANLSSRAGDKVAGEFDHGQGHSTSDVRPLVPQGSTTAEERLRMRGEI